MSDNPSPSHQYFQYITMQAPDGPQAVVFWFHWLLDTDPAWIELGVTYDQARQISDWCHRLPDVAPLHLALQGGSLDFSCTQADFTIAAEGDDQGSASGTFDIAGCTLMLASLSGTIDRMVGLGSQATSKRAAPRRLRRKAAVRDDTPSTAPITAITYFQYSGNSTIAGQQVINVDFLSSQGQNTWLELHLGYDQGHQIWTWLDDVYHYKMDSEPSPGPLHLDAVNGTLDFTYADPAVTIAGVMHVPMLPDITLTAAFDSQLYTNMFGALMDSIYYVLGGNVDALQRPRPPSRRRRALKVGNVDGKG